MTQPRSLLLVALALGLVVLVVEARVVAGGKTWDDVRYHTEIAPPRLAAAAAVRRGDLPTWWDGTGLGAPLAAEPSHGAAYPPLWLAATPHGLDLVLVAHVLWAALGVAVWARRRSASELGAVVAGVLVATSGLIASAAVRGALPGLAHLPWIGWAASWLAAAEQRRERARAAAVLAALIGAIGLAGQLGVVVDAIVLAVVVAGASRWLGAAIGAGLAIGAAQWLPAVLVLGTGAGAYVHALPLARLVELIVPGSFGATDPARAVTAISGAAPWAPSLYVGATLVALAAARRPDRRMAVVMCGFAAMTLVVGRGGWPAWLGAPELHLAALAIVAAAHSGVGLDAFVVGDRRAVVTVAIGAAATAIALGGLAMLRAHGGPAIDRALLDGGLGVASVAAAIALAWHGSARRTPLVIALIVAPGLAAIPSVAPAIDRAVVDDTPAWVRGAAAGPEPIRMYRPASVFDGPIGLAEQIATLAGTSAARFGVAAARSDDPARPLVDDRTWLASAHDGGALLDRYAISLAILPASVAGARGFTELGRRGRWSLVRLPTASPAAVFASWVWTRDADDAIARLFPVAGRGLDRGQLVLEGGGAHGADGPTVPKPCAIDRWTAGAIDLTCAASTDGYAAVSSTPARGWTVDVDGRATAWVTADVLRRAVAVSAGTHHVRWRYAAPGLALGLALGALGALGVAALAVMAVRARTRKRDRAPRATT